MKKKEAEELLADHTWPRLSEVQEAIGACPMKSVPTVLLESVRGQVHTSQPGMFSGLRPPTSRNSLKKLHFLCLPAVSCSPPLQMQMPSTLQT